MSAAEFPSRSDDLASRLVALYPCFDEAPPPGWRDDLAALPGPVTVPAGATLFSEGAMCQGFPLLLAGEVRVATRSPDGRELELYRVRAGEVCVVSATCLFSATAMAGHGIACTPTQVLSLPPEVFMRWAANEGFRRFVFGMFAVRMAELARLAEAVAFRRLDQRLASALLAHGGVAQTTHQALADELGTVREIVSRLLQRFEQAGWVGLARERIDIRDAAALAAVASGHHP